MDEHGIIKDVIDQDKKRRDAIFKIYKDIEAFLQTDVDLCHVVTTEFGDVTKRIEELEKTLNNSECPILVAGIYHVYLFTNLHHMS